MKIKHIVCTHTGSYLGYKNYWEKSGLDFEWLIDTTKGYLDTNHPNLQYNELAIRESLNFKHDVSKKHYWNSYGNRNIIWFFAHLRMLFYYGVNPGYDYYWFYDDDVTVKDWDTFHKAFENNTSDFISMYCFKDKNVIAQPNIPNIDDKTTSKHMWFERFPGDGDTLPKNNMARFGSFFPIVRLSNKALIETVKLHNEGFYGYSEGWLPTVLNDKELTLDTIYNNESQGSCFDDEVVDIKHKNTKIGWNWI
jgi:hypothetical protein